MNNFGTHSYNTPHQHQQQQRTMMAGSRVQTGSKNPFNDQFADLSIETVKQMDPGFNTNLSQNVRISATASGSTMHATPAEPEIPLSPETPSIGLNTQHMNSKSAHGITSSWDPFNKPQHNQQLQQTHFMNVPVTAPVPIQYQQQHPNPGYGAHGYGFGYGSVDNIHSTLQTPHFGVIAQETKEPDYSFGAGYQNQDVQHGRMAALSVSSNGLYETNVFDDTFGLSSTAATVTAAAQEGIETHDSNEDESEDSSEDEDSESDYASMENSRGTRAKTFDTVSRNMSGDPQTTDEWRNYLCTPVGPITNGKLGSSEGWTYGVMEFVKNEESAGGGSIWRFSDRSAGKVLMTAYRRKDGLKLLSAESNFAIFMPQHLAQEMVTSRLYTLSKIGIKSKAKSDPLYLGKVRGNSAHSYYQVFDNGMSPSKSTGVLNMRREWGSIRFAKANGSNQRRCIAAVPLPEQVRRPQCTNDTLDSRRKRPGDKSLQVLSNNSLNNSKKIADASCFQGVDFVKSIRNVVLHDPRDPNKQVFFALGKMESNTFNVYFRGNISRMCAFGFALATIDCTVNAAV